MVKSKIKNPLYKYKWRMSVDRGGSFYRSLNPIYAENYFSFSRGWGHRDCGFRTNGIRICLKRK